MIRLYNVHNDKIIQCTQWFDYTMYTMIRLYNVHND